MNTQLKRLEDKTIELTLSIPWEDIQKMYSVVVDDFVKETEVPGFRKGKAPRAAVEEKLDKNKVYEEVMQRMIPKVYSDAVEKEKVHPIVMPKITLTEAKEGSAWTILAITCERPTIELGDYKKAVQNIKATKEKKIWTPGQEPAKEDDAKEKKLSLDELLSAIYGAVKTTLPTILVDQEVNRLLSDLVDQTKKLGLTVEQYLTSTNRTADSIRHEYEEQAKRTLTLEFALEEIADKEGVLVSDDEIETVIKTAKSEEEKKSLEKQRYYLATILRRQKTIDMLANS
ncbi:MAG: trigger factor [Candidatus Gottesmanbacteria bacterium]